MNGARWNTPISLRGSPRCLLCHHPIGVQIWQGGFILLKGLPSVKKTKTHAYMGPAYDGLINYHVCRLNRGLLVFYLPWLCPSPGLRKAFPAISAIARSWTEIRGRFSPVSFLPAMPGYWRGKSQQESGPSLEGESLKSKPPKKNLGKRRMELYQFI